MPSRQIDEASGESDEKEQTIEKRPNHKLFNNNDFDEDAADVSREENKQATENEPFRRTNTSAYYRSIERKRKRYTPSAEELADDQEIKGQSSDEDDYEKVNINKDGD